MKGNDNHYDLIILGAGLAGLACADEVLSKTRKKILIIERNNYVGGLAATFQQNGFRYDLAPHRWFSKNKEVNEWVDKLVKGGLIWVEKNTPMYQMGKFFKYPIEIGDVVKKLDLIKITQIMGLYFVEKIKQTIRPTKIRTMEDAYIVRFGRGLYEAFNLEYSEKLWGEGGCKKMSADFFDQRIKNISFRSILANAFGLNKGKVVSLISRFRFPTKGVGVISTKLVERIEKGGGELKLGEEVVRIEKKKNIYLVFTNKNSYRAKNIISSIPLNKLIGVLKAKGRRVNLAARSLGFVHQRIVVLFVNRQRVTKYTWVYIHPKKIKAFRFMEMNNWSKVMSPKGKTSLIFEYPLETGDEIDRMSDEELIEMTKNDFLEYFTNFRIKKEEFLGGKVYLVPNAYPKYDLSYAKHLRTVKNHIKNKYKNLQLIGRGGMFHYNNMDHSVYTGILAARNFLSKKYIYDLDKVNNEAEYLEEIKNGN